MFQGCQNLKSVEIPNGVKYIGVSCFAESGIEEIILPTSVKEVGAAAFANCKWLKRVQLNEGLETLGQREVLYGEECEGKVFQETAIESIKIPSTLKRIEYETFNCCKNLKSVEIPNGVEYIGEYCFAGCGIEEITFPSTLKEVNKFTFVLCFQLETIFVEKGCTADVRKCATGAKVCYK